MTTISLKLPTSLLAQLEIVARPRGTSKEDEAIALRQLLRRYRNVPMSVADACLVRMPELKERSTVFTLDTDCRIYRRHGRKIIPTLMPPGIGSRSILPVLIGRACPGVVASSLS